MDDDLTIIRDAIDHILEMTCGLSRQDVRLMIDAANRAGQQSGTIYGIRREELQAFARYHARLTTLSEQQQAPPPSPWDHVYGKRATDLP